MTDRDKFERHVRQANSDLDECVLFDRAEANPDEYEHPHIQELWATWQAALASDGRRSVQDMKDVIAGFAASDDHVKSTDPVVSLARLIGRFSNEALRWCLRDDTSTASATMEASLEIGRKLREKA